MPSDVLRLCDTSLRDSLVSSATTPAHAACRELARALGAAGLDVVEVASSDSEPIAVVQSWVAAVGPVEACVIAPATSDAVAKALELLRDAYRPRIHLYADIATDGALAPALEAIFAARVNVDAVEFSPLRAFELPIDTVVELAVAARDSGATVLTLSDTRGAATPDQAHELVSRIAARLEAGASISFHGHDQNGRAIENALAACDAGARQIHVSVSGRAKRGTTTSLEGFVAACDARPHDGGWSPRIDRSALPGLVALAARLSD
jgi:isopropylmalate/homocitrate/citramalate synthase